MAEVLHGVDLRKTARIRRYPWTEWLDGKVRRLHKGKDFFCAMETLQNAFYARCSKAGKRGITRIESESTILVQAVND